MTSTVTKTTLSAALGAVIFAGAGAAYAGDNTPILYTHANAYQPGPTFEGTVARHDSDRKVVLAGHPNSYHIPRAELFIDSGVAVANK